MTSEDRRRDIERDIEPDTKDWTWVLDRPCPECGFIAAALGTQDLPGLLDETCRAWAEVLGRDDVRDRPRPGTWSPLEYAAHVRDVHRVFAERVRLMLAEDGPHFANWDQDETAVTGRYGDQDPAEVGADLRAASGRVAALYASVTAETRQRSGYRSDGSEFTIETLGRYHLHDVVHHLWDVRG
jgi:hypothetical protein